MVFGYARVSTKNQNEDRQIEALREYGVSENNIHIDKESGRNLERTEYQKLRNEILRKEDVLVVKELDRLSRNKSDIKNELEYFHKKGVRIVILDIPTTNIEPVSDKVWVMDMINNVLIEVLGSLAEEERKKIKSRQKEGISAARKKGVKFGRPQVKKPSNWDSVIDDWRSGKITAAEAMRRLKMKKTTFYRLVKEDSI